MVLKKFDRRCLPTTLAILRDDGVIVYPCGTSYGLIGRAPDTESRIRSIKGRKNEKPFMMLISDVDELRELVPSLPDARLLDFWPGPLTLVLSSRTGGNLILHVPEEEDFRELIAAVGAPLFFTSANRSGEDTGWIIDKIRTEFEDQVDLVVDAGDLPGWIPSTIVDATTKPYRLLRQGAAIVPEVFLA